MSLQLRMTVLCAKLVHELVLQLHRHKLPVLAGPAKEALIVNVVVELFGAEFQPGIEMSGPQQLETHSPCWSAGHLHGTC